MFFSLRWIATFPHRQQKKTTTNKQVKKEEITEMYKI